MKPRVAGGGSARVERRPAPGWHLPIRGGSHPQLAEVQRSRLLAATIRAVDELGSRNLSVSEITRHARVSRRTFYELFADREACLLAALEGAVESVEKELAALDLNGLGWCERVRTGLWGILSFFDREPALARACVVESLRGGTQILQARERVLTRLVAVVDEGRGENSRLKESTDVTAEGVVGAALAILYTRLLRQDGERLSGLSGELMGMIVLPYLGPEAARREQKRRAPAPARAATAKPGSPDKLVGDPLEGVRIRLTYRTVRVVECVAARPGLSNRQVGDAAGISDQGQISKLLARLERKGVLVNTGRGDHDGEPNAWCLTAIGERVAHSINSQPHEQPDEQREGAAA
ncbi:MAG: TetR/AcrR family transcriptional regulator [Solirubrobacteraceae bacterium]